MPIQRYADTAEARRQLQKINGRYRHNLNQFVKYCHASGVVICPECYSFVTSPNKLENNLISHNCSSCGTTFFKIRS